MKTLFFKRFHKNDSIIDIFKTDWINQKVWQWKDEQWTTVQKIPQSWCYPCDEKEANYIIKQNKIKQTV